MLCAPLHYLCCFQDRGGMARVGAAAADVAGERLFAVVLGRAGILAQKGLGRNNKTGRAIAALHRIPFAIGLNQRMPLWIGGDALDGFDRLAFAFHGEGGAGKHNTAVDNHRTGSADAAVAHLFGAREAEFVLKSALQSPMRLDQHFVIPPVHLKLGGTGRTSPGCAAAK